MCFVRPQDKYTAMASFAILPQILPDELLFTILKFASSTRVDWRSCKKQEASLIRSLEQGFRKEQDVLDWTLYGRRYMSETLHHFPEFGVQGFMALREPEPMEDFRRWYLLQYRWLHHVEDKENRWVCEWD